MSEKFRVLSDREHILERPSMYIGSMSDETATRFISGKLTQVTYVPALLKIINELIDNSVDEFIRTNGSFANKITIEMDASEFRISDNGRGIPIEKHDGIWQPELCWTACRAGTSFTNDRETIGANGVGSTAANIFSVKFVGISTTKTHSCIVNCKNNMETIFTTVTTEKSKDTGCTVFIKPDFQRFGVTGFDSDIISLVRERIVSIASIYPKLTFIFNKETIKCKKTRDYLAVFGDVYVLHEDSNYFLSIFPTSTDEYCHHTSFSGLEFHNGGTHEEYISNSISYELRDLIKKKYKLEMSPAEVKRGLFLIINGHSFPDMKFDSQTKERLTNSVAEVKRYFGDIPLSKICKQILATDEIIGPIIETKLAKQAAIDARAVTNAQKKLNSVKVQKHVKALSRKVSERRIFIVEGDCLEESTLVKVLNQDGIIENKQIKDIVIGDLVFTHHNRWKSVVNTAKRIKRTLTIKFNNKELKCSPEHRLYVYNIHTNKFQFIRADSINKNIHRLVKNNIFEREYSFIPIENIYDIDELPYSLMVETETLQYKTSLSHEFLCFTENGEFIKKCAKDLNIGDMLVAV